jgi:hypothetical protein
MARGKCRRPGQQPTPGGLLMVAHHGNVARPASPISWTKVGRRPGRAGPSRSNLSNLPNLERVCGIGHPGRTHPDKREGVMLPGLGLVGRTGWTGWTETDGTFSEAARPAVVGLDGRARQVGQRGDARALAPQRPSATVAPRPPPGLWSRSPCLSAPTPVLLGRGSGRFRPVGARLEPLTARSSYRASYISFHSLVVLGVLGGPERVPCSATDRRTACCGARGRDRTGASSLGVGGDAPPSVPTQYRERRRIPARVRAGYSEPPLWPEVPHESLG